MGYLSAAPASAPVSAPTAVPTALAAGPSPTFVAAVLARHVATRTAARGAPLPDLAENELASVGGTEIRMRTDSAEAATRLIAAARGALAHAKASGDPDALRTRDVTATSGYRSRGHQERVWRKYFPKYYAETEGSRSVLKGGPHGPAAIAHLVKYIGARVAAPGFSNHQAGIAIDLAQVRRAGHRIRNSTSGKWPARWRATWLHRWLEENAAAFGFVPYAKEPWHWEYKPS